MRKAYSQIFWGSIISVFNIYIGYINLLPNIIGYLLIISGVNNLIKNSKSDQFNKSLNKSIVLFILIAIVNVFSYIPLYGTFALLNVTFFALVYMFYLYFYYDLLFVSHKYIDNNSNTKSINNYFIIGLINIILLCLASVVNNDLLSLIYLIMDFSVKIYLLILIYRLRNHYLT